jgi:hypothetical protein
VPFFSKATAIAPPYRRAGALRSTSADSSPRLPHSLRYCKHAKQAAADRSMYRSTT